MQYRFTARIARVASVIIGSLVLSGYAAAVQYSGTRVTQYYAKDNPIPSTFVIGKLYVKGSKVRTEQFRQLGQPGKDITILRPDKGVLWHIFTDEKTYLEAPLPRQTSYAPIYLTLESLGGIPNVKLAGTEKMNGYECDKYQRFHETYQLPPGAGPGVPNYSGQLECTFWVSKKLNQVIKMEDLAVPGGKKIESLTDIQEKPQPDSLFEIPKGFKKKVQVAPQPPVPPATEKPKPPK